MVNYLQSIDEFKSIVEQSNAKLVVIDFTATWVRANLLNLDGHLAKGLKWSTLPPHHMPEM
jgi:hypothetical protein